MELSDVVNAHFAFPVVGVVLCAVLVFAFGFRSPAEPPSFDALDDDEKKTKKTRQRKQTHSDKKHGGDDVLDSPGRGPAGTARHLPSSPSSSGGGAAGGRSVGGKTTVAVPAPATDVMMEANKLKQPKLMKKPEDADLDADESLQQQDSAVVGDWTMAVSRKERKNRGKRDDASKHKRPVSLIDVSSHKMETPNSSPSPESNTSKKKLLEMPKVTVTVRASHTAHAAVAATTTSTTVTKNAVVKLKVVPPVHISTGNNVIAAAATGSEQVLARNSGVNQETDTSADSGLVEVTSLSVVDGGQMKQSSALVDDDSYDVWSEVKSSRRKKTVSEGSVENQQVTTSGISVQSSMIYAQSRVSGFLKTADSPSDVVSVTQCSSSMSKPLTGPPPADGRSQDVGVKVDDCSSSSFVKVQAPASPRTCSVSVPSETKSNQPAVSHSSKEDNIKIDVSISSRLPESSHMNASAVGTAAADCQQPNSASDVLPAGTAEGVACNGSEVKTEDLNADTGGVQSSEETGDWHQAMSQKRRKRLRKDA